MESGKIVVLVGGTGTGKDTLAKHFVGKGFEKVTFGDEVKREIYPNLPGGEQYLDKLGEEDREWKDGVRDQIILHAEMQKIKQSPFHWVNKTKLIDVLDKRKDKVGDIIVTDCRRIEEMHWFLSHANRIKVQVYFVHVFMDGVVDEDYRTNQAIEYGYLQKIFSAKVESVKGKPELLEGAADDLIKAMEGK
jgi:hypothetical protein